MNTPTATRQTAITPPTKRAILPAIVITLLTFTATLIAGYITEQAATNRLNDFFKLQADQIANTYASKLRTHVAILEGMRGYWNATGNFTYHNVTRYLESLDLESIDNAGVSSYFFIPAIGKMDQAKFEAKVKQESNIPDVYKTYAIHPESTESFLYPVTYGFPLKGRESVIGLDYGTIPERKDAITYARDTGLLATTKALNFQTTNKPGFFFFLPLYRPNMSLERAPERKLAFAGLVGASFRAESAFEQIYGNLDPYPYLDFQIYQGAATTPDRLLHDHDESFTAESPRFSTSRIVTLQDQTWTIIIQSKPKFSLSDPEEHLPLIVFVSGILATLVLAIFSAFNLAKILRSSR